MGPVWVTVGGVAGLFVIIGSLYKFRIWLWTQIKAVIAVWRTRKQVLTDIKALQEQVAALTERLSTAEFTAIRGIADLHLALEEMGTAVTQLEADMAETKEVRELQSQVNSDLKDFGEHLSTQITELQAQVKELDRGGWLRLGGKQKVE